MDAKIITTGGRLDATVTATVRWKRGVISGLLSLSRNLGLITGASMMGTVFAVASATTDIASAGPDAVATGMRRTFAVAALLIVASMLTAVWSRARPRETAPGDG